jgi:hypothetical protein
MLESAIAFIGRITSSLIVSLVSHSIREKLKRGVPLPFSLSLHLAALEAKVRDMPFIYKDLEGDILNDFVELEIESVDLATLRIIQSKASFGVDQEQKLRNSRRLLLLGNAGVGKTTFQRHTILKIIHRELDVDFLYAGEKPIPFYVPLKAVDNMRQWPILRYVLEDSGITLGALRRLAERGKLFLFLDGYDEIPFANIEKAEPDFVQEELSLMVSPKPRPRDSSVALGYVRADSPEAEFYRALAGCRVWLSSRREFFEQHPLSTGHQTREMAAHLKAVELVGVGNNRLKLVKRIFDKYRNRSGKYNELLSDEYVIQEIDNSNDEEMRRLSYNPLFLTIMCYIYARKAIELGDCRISWSETFYELIRECIHLLLRDLDETKARDLPRAQREALLRRRNTYIDEKFNFLQFFAYGLFFDEQAVFDIEYIKARIRVFVKSESDSPSGRRIVEELTETKASYPNMALQLIFSGIFIIVDRGKSGAVYDFPHRRFREVLACEFVGAPERYAMLLANMHKKSFAEFVHVFLRSPSFRNAKLQEATLRLILERAASDAGQARQVTQAFMQIKPADYDPGDVISAFLIEALGTTDISFEVSRDILAGFAPPDDFVIRLVDLCRHAMASAEAQRLSLCCALLHYYNRPLLNEFLQSNSRSLPENMSLASVLLQYLCRAEGVSVLDRLDQLRSQRILFCHFAFIVAAERDVLPWDEREVVIYLSVLPRSDRVAFLFVLWKYNRALYDRVAERSDPSLSSGLFESICEAARFPGKALGSPKQPAEYFAVTESLIRAFQSLSIPSFVVKVIEKGVTVDLKKKKDRNIKTKAQTVETKVVERLYALLDFDRLRGMILERLAPLRGRLFESEEELTREIDRAVLRPREEVIAQLEFHSSESWETSLSGDEQQVEMTLETFRKCLDDVVRKWRVRVVASLYAETLGSIGDLVESFSPPRLSRFFS